MNGGGAIVEEAGSGTVYDLYWYGLAIFRREPPSPLLIPTQYDHTTSLRPATAEHEGGRGWNCDGMRAVAGHHSREAPMASKRQAMTKA